MTTEVKTRQYNKALKTNIVSEYTSVMDESGLSEAMIKSHIWAARAFLDLSPKDPKELTENDFQDIEKKVLKKYAKRTSAQYVANIGHFLQFYLGRNPYMKDSTHFQSPWLDKVKATECDLDDRIAEWKASLKESGLSDSTAYEMSRRTTIAIKALILERGQRPLSGYTREDAVILKALLKDLQKGASKRYIKAFIRFVDECCTSDEKETDAYVNYLRRKGLKETTIRSRLYAVRSMMDYIEREFGRRYDPLEVDADFLRALVSRLSFLVKESTLRIYVRIFCEYVDFLSGEKDHLGELGLRWNGNLTEDADRKFITDEQLFRIISVADPEEYMVIALGSGLGMRASEIAHLKLQDISGDQITIRGKGHGSAGKTSTRTLPAEVRKAIEMYLPVRQAILDEYGDRSEGNILVRKRIKAGMPANRNSVESIVQNLKRKSGVDFSCHSFRRLFATTAYEMTKDLATLKSMMRHANIETTFQCYIYADPSRRDLATENVASRLLGARELS